MLRVTACGRVSTFAGEQFLEPSEKLEMSPEWLRESDIDCDDITLDSALDPPWLCKSRRLLLRLSTSLAKSNDRCDAVRRGKASVSLSCEVLLLSLSSELLFGNEPFKAPARGLQLSCRAFLNPLNGPAHTLVSPRPLLAAPAARQHRPRNGNMYMFANLRLSTML